MEPRDVPLAPYALGLLLGDGCTTTATTPGIEARRRPALDYALVVSGRGRGGAITANPVTAALRDLGLAGTTSATKHVPADYLVNSAAVRLALLQGLLDSDGGPVRQRGRTCRIQYATVSPRLRDDVTYLVRSLGGVAYSGVRRAAGRAPGLARGGAVRHRHDAYVLDIRLPSGIAPFRLARKRAAYEEAGGGVRPMRFVDRIDAAGYAECVCIAVGAQDSLYVAEDFVVTHNTLNDAFIILDEAQNTSPEQMKMFLTRLGFGSKIVVTGDVTQIDLPSGTQSGLKIVRDILDGIEDVHFTQLGSGDVVRHKLVSEIVDAYARFDAENTAARATPAPARGQRKQRR